MPNGRVVSPGSTDSVDDEGSVTSSTALVRKRLRSVVDDVSKNFKVVIRIRPPLPRELAADKNFVRVSRVDEGRVITLSENLAHDAQTGSQRGEFDGVVYSTQVFTFDHVYDETCQQPVVYETTARPAVQSVFEGYNATIFAYGQTGTGKTYTMEGFKEEEERGIIPRATEEIFNYIEQQARSNKRFLVRASYLQIYNEFISDLLKPDRKNLQIREDKKRGVFVEGLSEWVVRTPQEIYGLMERGASIRATGETRMNELSSRSHAVFIIIVEQSEVLTGEAANDTAKKAAAVRAGGELRSFKIGKLNLVDLAGSERVRLSGATGVRLEESKKINQSLSALGNVIAALTDAKGRQHIPYRDSKLTRILEDSLGGNCKTTMMAMVSPALECFSESLSTLKFANRAKNIKNQPRVNEDLDQRALLRKYERELKRLREELQTKSKVVVDQRRILELEESRRRAEQDKLAAITALEKRSREFMKEKEAKRMLEERIMLMQSQMLVGGARIEETPQFRNALMQEYQRVHKKYEHKLAELEKERESIEEDKAQVDRYKQLLLKQRDIMIALTARLNERDESILALQEELDAYDRHQRLLEDGLDRKTALMIKLERVLMEHGLHKIPELSGVLEEWANSKQLDIETNIVPGPSGGELDIEDGHTFSAQIPGGKKERPSRTSSDSKIAADRRVEQLSEQVQEQKKANTALMKELESLQSEKGSLEFVLREKVDKMVQSEIEERVKKYKHEIDHWKASNSLSEEKRRASEYILELAKMNADSPEFHERLSQVMNREKDALKRLYEEKLGHLVKELDAKKQESDKLQSIVDSQHMQSAGASPAGVEAVWKRVHAAEDEVRRLRRELSESQSNDGGSPANENSQDEIRELRASYEDKISTLMKERDVEEGLWRQERQSKLRELMTLKQTCSTNSKERAALKAIMSQKIKTMVDNVGRMIMQAASTSSSDWPTLQSRMSREVHALQKLVNASISAMNSTEDENNNQMEANRQRVS